MLTKHVGVSLLVEQSVNFLKPARFSQPITFINPEDIDKAFGQESLSTKVAMLEMNLANARREAEFFKAELIIQKNKTKAAEDKARLIEQNALHGYADVVDLCSDDELTGMAKRHQVEVLITKMIQDKVPFALVMFDIDHFKKVNDTYGHSAGDLVLKEIKPLVDRRLRRKDDVLCRWGGEEFLLVLPYSDQEDGIVVAESIRKAVEGNKVPYKDTVIKVTISAGVTGSSEGLSGAELIEDVDGLLYEAKRTGRNRVIPPSKKRRP